MGAWRLPFEAGGLHSDKGHLDVKREMSAST